MFCLWGRAKGGTGQCSGGRLRAIFGGAPPAVWSAPGKWVHNEGLFWCCVEESNDVVRLIVRVLCGRGWGSVPWWVGYGKMRVLCGTGEVGGAVLALDGGLRRRGSGEGRGCTCGC